jgi:hypothetical protein
VILVTSSRHHTSGIQREISALAPPTSSAYLSIMLSNDASKPESSARSRDVHSPTCSHCPSLVCSVLHSTCCPVRLRTVPLITPRSCRSCFYQSCTSDHVSQLQIVCFCQSCTSDHASQLQIVCFCQSCTSDHASQLQIVFLPVLYP